MLGATNLHLKVFLAQAVWSVMNLVRQKALSKPRNVCWYLFNAIAIAGNFQGINFTVAVDFTLALKIT